MNEGVAMARRREKETEAKEEGTEKEKGAYD